MADASNPARPSTFGEWSRRRFVWSAVAGGLVLLRNPSNNTYASLPAIPARESDDVTPETQRAIRRGLDWLAARQKSDGGFGAPRTYARDAGVCALGGLAFLADGLRDPFHENASRCTEYLLANSRPDGFIQGPDSVTHAPLYGHGFAAAYLGQVRGWDRRAEVASALNRAIACLLAAQSRSGGWHYTSDPEDADVSVTTCQMMALFSAAQAGIAIPRQAIDRSVDFLCRCQNPDGGFRYRLKDPPSSLFPRSAAAVVALRAAGLHDSNVVRKACDYLAVPRALPAPSLAEYYYYGQFYATHAAWQAGGATWNDWYPVVREELMEKQSGDGHWEDPTIGSEYATAMALLTLQIPLGMVPLFSI